LNDDINVLPTWLLLPISQFIDWMADNDWFVIRPRKD
jgi:hypothetical protein